MRRFKNREKLAMERIYLFSLRLAVEEIMMRMREFEDPLFSGEFAQMNRQELELLATRFIYDKLDGSSPGLDGLWLNQNLADIRYSSGELNGKGYDQIKEELMCRGGSFDDYDFDGYEGDEGA